MRILVSLSYYVPNLSGLTRYVQLLVQDLNEKGNNVVILTSQHKNLPHIQHTNGNTIIRVPIIGIIKKIPIMPKFFLKAFSQVKSADVVNCHLPQVESIIISILAWVMRKRLIITYHTDVQVFGKKLAIFDCIMSFTHFLPLVIASKIVVNTKDYADNSIILKIFHKKLVYIFPPIQIPRINVEKRKELAQRVKNYQYKIGFLGRLAKEKGVEYLLQAIPLLKDKLSEKIVILIAGSKDVIGEGRYGKKINALTERYKDNVILLGKLSDDELGAFYDILDVFVLPSINATESFGMVQVESMLCETPVVASDLPGVRVPIITTRMGELAEPKNSQDFAGKIVKILKNKKKYVKERDYIENKFSLKNTVSEYEKLFV